ncbi:hypothetical protein RM844_26720 [Streptomyces sp. DSM 44915]|uniref:Uncharacterized protein n=1 Tax=Streptomyces chisholmiae TaxID=3075540 RepID=A0ABU2JY00_9ACTN|nr:hypothetical protein [Streptomyces sp. DSM 44915]MDT0269881.1 hypothetical protein [Streptomyces sp. DSM 44915]
MAPGAVDSGDEAGAGPASPGPPGGAVAAPPAEEADGPRPLGVGTRPTGHGPVDAALARLPDVDQLGVGGHLAVYEDVHDGLRRTLAALDQPAGPPTPGAGPHPTRS